jgi:hypothetical protein
VTIGNGVTSIGYQAFNGTDSLTEITYEGTVAEWTALNTEYISEVAITVHCTDGDTVVKYGSDD